MIFLNLSYLNKTQMGVSSEDPREKGSFNAGVKLVGTGVLLKVILAPAVGGVSVRKRYSYLINGNIFSACYGYCEYMRTCIRARLNTCA